MHIIRMLREGLKWRFLTNLTCLAILAGHSVSLSQALDAPIAAFQPPVAFKCPSQPAYVSELENPNSRPKTQSFLKTNVLALPYSNVVVEAEIKPWNRWGIIAVGSWQRTFEDITQLRDYRCRDQVGFGNALGMKFYLLQAPNGRHSTDGISLKGLMAINIRNDRGLHCDKPEPEIYPLRRGWEYSPVVFLCFQSTVFGRVIVEPQMGVGLVWARYNLHHPDPAMIWPYDSERLTRWSVPFGLNIGYCL